LIIVLLAHFLAMPTNETLGFLLIGVAALYVVGPEFAKMFASLFGKDDA
jgi:hypothetical protein